MSARYRDGDVIEVEIEGTPYPVQLHGDALIAANAAFAKGQEVEASHYADLTPKYLRILDPAQPEVGPIRGAMESITDEVMGQLVAKALKSYDERAKTMTEIWRLRALGLGDQWQPIWTMPSNGEWFIVSDGEFTTTAWVEPMTKKLNLLAEPDCWGEAFIWCEFPKVPRLDR